MHFAYCFDEKYQQHFAAAISSLIQNFDNSKKITVHVVTDSLNKEFRDKVNSFANTDFCEVNWINFDKRLAENLPIAASTHFSSAIYFRLFLPELLPKEVEKIVYLDSDTICMNDLSPLNDIKINDAYIAGVLDPNSAVEANRLQLENYINSGVLIFNLAKWRNEKIAQKCFVWLYKNKQSILGDQDAINVICKNHILHLDSKWNVCINPAFIEIPEEMNIIHYITHMKPWQAWYDDALAQPYDDYLNLTPWKNKPKDEPQTVNQWMLFARKKFNQGKFKESQSVYEDIIKKLAERLA